MIKYLLIAISALLVSGFMYYNTQPELSKWRKIFLVGMRSLSIALILILIVSPILYFVRSRVETPKILVLKDVSYSMELISGKQTKQALLRAKLSTLTELYKTKGYEIVQYDFADGLSANKSNSLLSPVLNQIPIDHKLSQIQGIILSSDGWLKDESLAMIKQLNVPFYALADTSVSDIADLMVLGARTNKFAYRNEPTLFQADIKALNTGGNVKTSLKINDKTVAERTLSLAANTIETVEFIHRFPQTGFYNYKIEISSSDLRERSLNNNVFPGALEVLSEKEKLYVISDQPGWDNKFIIDALATNPRWETTHISIRNGQLLAENKTMNSLEDSPPAAMIIINNGTLKLGKAVTDAILRLHTKGCGILYQGMPIVELQDILPIRQSNISSSYQGFLSWNPEAQNYPMLAVSSLEQSRIPPIDYFYTVANPGAVTAIAIDNPQRSPAIAFRSAANRRSVALSFLNLWRWQMQSPESQYQSLITNLVVWLSSTGRESFDAIYSSSYFLGESIVIKLRSEDDIRQTRTNLSPRLQIFDAKDNLVFDDFMALEKDQFGISTSLTKAGNYKFTIADRESGKRTEGRFTVSESSLEERDFDFNLPLLAWIAFETDGELITDPSQHTPPPANRREVILRDEFSLYRKWYILVLFILAFSTELFFRRRWGLL